VEIRVTPRPMGKTSIKVRAMLIAGLLYICLNCLAFCWVSSSFCWDAPEALARSTMWAAYLSAKSGRNLK